MKGRYHYKFKTKNCTFYIETKSNPMWFCIKLLPLFLIIFICHRFINIPPLWRKIPDSLYQPNIEYFEIEYNDSKEIGIDLPKYSICNNIEFSCGSNKTFNVKKFYNYSTNRCETNVVHHKIINSYTNWIHFSYYLEDNSRFDINISTKYGKSKSIGLIMSTIDDFTLDEKIYLENILGNNIFAGDDLKEQIYIKDNKYIFKIINTFGKLLHIDYKFNSNSQCIGIIPESYTMCGETNTLNVKDADGLILDRSFFDSNYYEHYRCMDIKDEL